MSKVQASSQGAPQVGEPFPLSTLRHSVSHLMASAVAELWPGTRFGFGPAIEHGFYYDFDLPQPLEEKDLKRVEKTMRKIAQRSPELRCERVSREAARERLAADGQDYKVEALDLIPPDEAITFYRHGAWEDLCEGPHIDRLDRPFHFKLLSIAGAYWRGDEHRPMLQRVYGTAFWTQAELEAHIEWLEEMKRRDHRAIGADLDLFSTHPEAGSGFIFWHPALGKLRRALEEWVWGLLEERGYEPVYTPHVAREQLFGISGHLQNYGEMMYASMAIDELPYRVKPMNCPGHILIYKSKTRSYRDLPLRWAELGTVYRYERSGTLHGMGRVRGFTQDDAHVFCTSSQLPGEIERVCELVDTVLATFGLEYTAYLATRPEANTIGEPQAWDAATAALREGAERFGLALELDEGGGAFYGPKIDYKIRDALGRAWQLSTVQCDFNLPERFDMHFADSDGTLKRPIMLHRAVFGSLERFVSILIEHFGAKFPFWCAPTQVAVIPIREGHAEYARRLAGRLRDESFRVDCLDQDSHMNKRIKEAQHAQVPYMLVVGDREAEEGTVAVRRRGTREQQELDFEAFLVQVRALRATRALELT